MSCKISLHSTVDEISLSQSFAKVCDWLGGYGTNLLVQRTVAAFLFSDFTNHQCTVQYL